MAHLTGDLFYMNYRENFVCVVSVAYVAVTKRMLLMIDWLIDDALVVASDDGPWPNMERCSKSRSDDDDDDDDDDDHGDVASFSLWFIRTDSITDT